MNIKEAILRLQLLDGVTGPARGITKALEGLDTRIAGFDGAIRKTRWQLLDAGAAFAAGAAALSFPVRQAMQLEDAMADVAKVSGFEGAGLEKLKQDFIDLSKQIPMTAAGISAIAAELSAAGTADEELIRMTGLVARTGVAFGMTGEQAGENLGKIRAALGLTIEQTERYADQINALSDATASSANDLTDFSRRVGSLGAMYGYSSEEVLAYGSAMISAGATAETAATGFQAVGRALVKGAAASKPQQQALARLGLTSKAVAKGMAKDALATTQGVFDRIRALPDFERASVVNQLFGDEAKTALALIENVDLLAKSLGVLADETRVAGSVTREFDNRTSVTSGRLKLLRNRALAAATAYGDSLLPSIVSAADALGPLVDSVGNFVRSNPELVKNVTLAGGALLGLNVAAAAGRLGMLMVGRQALVMARPVLVAALAVTQAGAAVAAFSTAKMVAGLAAGGRALRTFAVAASLSGVGPAAAAALGTIGRSALGLLNPVRLLTGAMNGLKWAARGLLIGTGVGAIFVGLGMAADWAIKNWDNLKVAFNSFKDSFLAGIAPLRDDPTFKRLAGDASELLSGIRRLTSEGDPTAFAQAGASAGRTLAEGFKSAAEVIDRVVAGIKYLRAELAGFSEFQVGLNKIGLNIGKTLRTDKVGPWLKRQVGLGDEASVPGDKTAAERLGVNIGVTVPKLDLTGITADLPAIKPTFDLVGFEGAAKVAGEGAGSVLGAGVADALKGQQPRVLGDFGSIMSGLRAAVGAGITVPVKLQMPSMVGLPAPAAAPAPVEVDGKREHGGPVDAGRTYLVGERGPELFRPNTSGTVVPNHETPAALGGTAPAPRPALRIAAAAAAVAIPTLAAAAPAPVPPTAPVTAGAIYTAAQRGEPLPTSRPAPAPFAPAAPVQERRVVERPQVNVATPVVPAPQVAAPAPVVAPAPAVNVAAPAGREPAAPAPITNNIHAPITLTVNVKAGDGTAGSDIAAQVEKAARKALNEALGAIDRTMLRRPQVTFGGTLYGDF